MELQQLRNATMLLTMGSHKILVDPMLCKPGAIPGLRFFRGERKANPLVSLPEGAMELMAGATDVLITHEHPDHLDVPAVRWLKKREIPLWASSVDAPNLARKGLRARALPHDDFGLDVEVIPTKHGRGIMGWLMGPVSGFYLTHPDEPSVYITGDSVLTDTVQEAIERLQPDVIVAPAGAANFGVGSDILFSVDELVALVKMSQGQVVFNHLEALDHCLTTRQGLRARMEKEGLGTRVYIPQDGELVSFERPARASHAPARAKREPTPGFQKWLTAKFAGT